MRKVTIRSLWTHKRRLISTVISIVLGVAFMSGTFVFADTVDQVFDDLFAEGNENLDARVQGKELFGDAFSGSQRARLPADLLETVRGVDGVREAHPMAMQVGFGVTNRVLDKEGEPIGATQGPPTLVQSWVDSELLNPYRIREGRPPGADEEIALNVAAAEDGEYEIGDTVAFSSQFGLEEYTLVGVFTFGTAESSAGAVSATFTLAEAQRLIGADGELTSILVAAEEGVTEEELVATIEPVVPDTAEVLTGAQATEEDASEVQEGFAFFRVILTIFAAIALLVGMFIISNTFSILVAQRTRELALLRAIGASRAQVLRSVLVEAVLVGLLASVIGLASGIGLAALVSAILESIGAEMPSTTLVISPLTIMWAFLAGTVVTVIAAMGPAIRATRVPPLAALRDVAIERPGPSKPRIIIGVLVFVLGVLNLSRAWTADGDTDAVPTVGMGALLVIIAAIIVGPVLAGPSVRLIGSVLPRLRGVTGRLAMENAARAPKRTSATASALLIGVALIGFITVFAATATESVDAEVTRGLNADLIVQAEQTAFGFSGFSPAAADAVATVEGVDETTSFGFGAAGFTYPDGETSDNFLVLVDPATVGDAMDPRMVSGSLTELTDDGIIVDRQIAEDNELEIGDPILATLPGGAMLSLTIEGISDDMIVLGPWTMTQDAFRSVAPEYVVGQTYVQLADGADLETVRARIEEAISAFPQLEAVTLDEFIGDLADQLTVFVNVIYALLIVSVLIAAIGIGNTISLSVHERTRELGLLRAVGATRGQIRSAIRWEAVVISVLGTLVGLALGLVLSRVLVEALSGFNLTQFTVPVGSLIFSIIGFALLGVLASLWPAHKASKLDVLDAIATE